MAHFVINTSTSVGSALQTATNKLRDAMEGYARVTQLMGQAIGTANYASVEGGIFGVATAQGQSVYTEVATINSYLGGINTGSLASIDQGQ